MNYMKNYYLCGSAVTHGCDMKNNREGVGPVMQKLYNALTQIQKGERADPFGWTVEVEL